jgi:hypothetical protein
LDCKFIHSLRYCLFYGEFSSDLPFPYFRICSQRIYVDFKELEKAANYIGVNPLVSYIKVISTKTPVVPV